MTVCSGPSGSGKSSLAIDTLYAEGQRRYVESLSQLRPPVPRAVAEAEGRADQRPLAGRQHRAEDDLARARGRRSAPSPRSTTTCASSSPGSASPTARPAACRSARRRPTRSSRRSCICPRGRRSIVMAPVERRDGETYDDLWDDLRGSGFSRVRVDGKSVSLDEPPKLEPPPQAPDRGRDRPRGRAPLDAIEAGRLGRVGARPGQRGRARRPRRRRGRRGALARRPLQPAPLVRRLRPELRGALAASLLVQQPARLVPRLRRARHPARRESRRAHPRRQALAPRGGRRRLADFAENPHFARMIEAMAKAQGIDLDTPFDELEGRHRRAILHGTGDAWFAVAARRRPARVLVPVQGALPGDRGGRAGLVRLPVQAPGDGRRRPLRLVHGGPAPRRLRGRPVPRLHDRPDRPVAARPGASSSSRRLKLERRRDAHRRRPDPRDPRPPRSSWSTSASTTSRSRAARQRSPAARASGSAWPARSAAA